MYGNQNSETTSDKVPPAASQEAFSDGERLERRHSPAQYPHRVFSMAVKVLTSPLSSKRFAFHMNLPSTRWSTHWAKVTPFVYTTHGSAPFPGKGISVIAAQYTSR